MSTSRIAVLPGDGIGPEIVREAVKVLKAFGSLEFDEQPVGGTAHDKCGDALPDATLRAAREADAVLLGAVGGPKWDSLAPEKRPEKRALLTLRSELGLFANLRPARVWTALAASSPLKPEIVGDGFELLVVRELTGGVYFGRHERASDGLSAIDTMPYSVAEIERIARVAFRAARSRVAKRVTSVDKANVLATSRLWRETVSRIAADEFPDVALEHMYVDNAAMQLVRAPRKFDVLLTENMFGDILSDLASQLAGSIGLLPSASLREDSFGMYEPIHGSAPDIAGQGVANPLATILSGAMMLRLSLGRTDEAAALERAIARVLDDPECRTRDIGGTLSTSQMGDAVLARL